MSISRPMVWVFVFYVYVMYLWFSISSGYYIFWIPVSSRNSPLKLVQSICLFAHPSSHLSIQMFFMESDHMFFSKFWNGVNKQHEVERVTAKFLNLFVPKLSQNRSKWGFFKLLKNLVIRYQCIWSLIGVDIICLIPSMKNLVLDFRIFKPTTSQWKIDEIAWFFVCWCKFTKI